MKKVAILFLINFLISSSYGQIKDVKWEPWMIHPCYKGLSVSVLNMGYGKDAKAYLWGVRIKNGYDIPVTFEFRLIIGDEIPYGTRATYQLKPGETWTDGSDLFTANPYKSSSNAWKVEIGNVCFAGMRCGGNDDCYANCDVVPTKVNQPCGLESHTSTKPPLRTNPSQENEATVNNNTSNSSRNGNSNNSTTTDPRLQNGTSKRVLNAADCAMYFPNGHPSDCIWASCPCAHNGEVMPTTSETGNSSRPNQSVALTLLQDQEFMKQTTAVLTDLFNSIKERKEEKRKQRVAELEEKTKIEAYDLLYNSPDMEMNLQFLVDELLKQNPSPFIKVKDYTINDVMFKSAELLFEDYSIKAWYTLFQKMESASKKGMSLMVLHAVNRSFTLKCKNKELLNTFKQSNLFKTISKYCKEPAYTDSTINFPEVDFTNSKEFKNFSTQWNSLSHSVNVNQLLDSITQRAEGPIDNSRKLTDVLIERAEMYGWGKGVKQDEAIELYYYEKAAALGSTRAMYSLYLKYKYKDGAINKEKAADWLRKACEGSNPDNYYCKEYEKQTGKKVTPSLPSSTTSTTSSQVIEAPSEIAIPLILKNNSEWTEINNTRNRIIFYRSNDSLVTSRPGILGYTAYKLISPGKYEIPEKQPDGSVYKILFTENNKAIQEIYANGEKNPTIYNLQLLSATPALSQPVASREIIADAQIRGTWKCENSPEKTLQLIADVNGITQCKFTGFKPMAIKPNSQNKYVYEDANLLVVITILNTSEISVLFYYKKIGMQTLGQFIR